MTTTPNSKPTTSANEDTDTFDRAEVSRLVSMIRYEISTLVTDAQRKRPLFSKSQKEARSRRDASFTVLKEFAERLTSMRTE